MEDSPYRQFAFSWSRRRFLEPIPGYSILGTRTLLEWGPEDLGPAWGIPRAGQHSRSSSFGFFVGWNFFFGPKLTLPQRSYTDSYFLWDLGGFRDLLPRRHG
ncbi:hypothetical protein YC2023_061033 [Brassica napus]